jgi:predicted transposase YdaD
LEVLYYVNGGIDGRLPITRQRDFCTEASREVILHKTLKVKREADKVKAVYSLGSGWAVKLTTEVLDIDEQTVRQYFLDYQNQGKRNQRKNQWVTLHYTGKESSLANEQEQDWV